MYYYDYDIKRDIVAFWQNKCKGKTQMKNNSVLDRSVLESKLGVKLEKVKKDNTKLSLKAQIMRKINQRIHELLCSDFSDYYKEIETDVIVTSKHGSKTTLESVKGYRLLIPKDDIMIGNETHKGYSVGKPTTYVDGINTNDCIYFKEVGSTKTK